VRDVHDRRPAGDEPTDDLAQLLGLIDGQRRRRLVHHDKTRTARDRAQDLDLLLVRDTEVLDTRVGVKSEARIGDDRLDARPQFAAGDQPAATRLLSEHDVGGHRELRDELELLGD